MAENRELFETMPVEKAIRKMAVPTVLGQLIVLIYNLADTFFIGRTNDPAMVAGASLILPLFNISLSISGLCGIGGGSLMSRLLGEKRDDEAGRVYSFCVYLSVFSAAAFSMLTLIFMRPVIGFLGAAGDSYDHAASYAFCVIVCGGVPTVLENTVATLLRSVGESRKASIGIMMGGIINVALDPLFMFVILPDGMEVLGAGIATCISNCIGCIYFAIVIKKMDSSVMKLRPFKEHPTKKSVGEVFFVGVPSSIVTLLFDFTYMIIGKLMSAYGDEAMAAIGIVLKAERLPLNICVGLSQGMMPIVAYNYTAGNIKRLKEAKNYTVFLGLCTSVISIVIYEVFAGFIIRFFIGDYSTVMLGTGFLRVRCLATPFMFFSFLHVNVFNSMGRGNISLALGVTRWLLLNIPLLYLLEHFFGKYGIVWTQVIADSITTVLSFVMYGIYVKHNLTVIKEKKT